eukprot:11201206-Lingulodinium_polyedra.AAC.1
MPEVPLPSMPAIKVEEFAKRASTQFWGARMGVDMTPPKVYGLLSRPGLVALCRLFQQCEQLGAWPVGR